VAEISDYGGHVILTVQELLGKLWHSSDIMPRGLRERLQEQRGWEEELYTYAQAAQRLRTELQA
jgi:hypothetical protein